MEPSGMKKCGSDRVGTTRNPDAAGQGEKTSPFTHDVTRSVWTHTRSRQA
jgi:hypothetical protein